MSVYLAIGLVSGGMLLFELGLTRLLAVAQFHHFAFMLISLALLGVGASGTLLALAAPGRSPRWWSWYGLGFAATATGSFLFLNRFPFDSFSIAWDGRQAALLSLNFLGLATPFVFAGLAVGAPLAERPEQAGRLYAANLVGSAFGCALVVWLPARVGGEGVVLVAAGMGAIGGALFAVGGPGHSSRTSAWALNGAALAALALIYFAQPGWLTLRLSPYKPLAQALNFPGARVALTRWGPAERVDVVESPGIRSLPGLSFSYAGSPPLQAGLMFDGDALAPIPGVSAADAAFAAYLPAYIAYALRPGADALILEPGGGLDVLAALASGARRVTAVHGQTAAIEVLTGDYAAFSHGLYVDPRVTPIAVAPRAYVRGAEARFDVVQLALTDPYRPVASGAYSLAESYLLTVEAFRDYFARLTPDGIFVVTRWLQAPPSEELRTYAAIRAALNSAQGVDSRIIAFRSFQAATFLVRPTGFSLGEMEAVREFAAARRFDLLAGPGMLADETNRYNVLPEPAYYTAFAALNDAYAPTRFFSNYPFDVRPAADDRPFFFHFFKWAQTSQVLQTVGRTWQPFGGAGYFVLILLLGVAVAGAGALLSLPMLARVRGPRAEAPRPRLRALAYFACLGAGFLLVEIPLTQAFVLLLDRPIYALAAVLGGMLAFSGLGSWFSARFSLRRALAALVALAWASAALLPVFIHSVLGWPFGLRLAAAVLSLAPLGWLMGVPFPAGLARFAARTAVGALAPASRALVPWAWAANGGASVVTGVLAAMLALSLGFRAVILIGGLAYLGALVALAGPSARD